MHKAQSAWKGLVYREVSAFVCLPVFIKKCLLLPEKGGEKKEKLLFMEPLLYCGLSQIALSSFSRECFANGAEATWKSRRGLSTG